MAVTQICVTDLAACAELYTNVFSSPPWSEDWTTHVAQTRLTEMFETPGALGLAIREEDQVIGFVMGYGETYRDGVDFYIKEMCVATACQGQGLGTRLLDVLEEKLRNSGVRKMYLLTARDSGAQGFYQAKGFYTSEKMIMMGRWLTAPSVHPPLSVPDSKP